MASILIEDITNEPVTMAPGVRLEPLGPRVLVLLDDAVGVTTGGIVLPHQAQKPPAFGVIMAVGQWERDYPEILLNVGDHVLVNKYGGQSVKIDGKEFLVLNVAADVLAIQWPAEDDVAVVAA